ncbi:MAG: translation initiation factor IF-2 subunit alpha [Candidatus Woesearchaeota archaeon]
MLFQKQGFPEEGELVLSTITAVQPNSVFVKLDEYGKSGMIHISEIAAGRIRNIRDFVKEGKKVVCVVLRINLERGHIDLSLRRVNDSQRKKKVEYIKLIQKSEKIIEYVAQQNKLKTIEYYKIILEKIKADYTDLVSFFNDVVNEGVSAQSYDIPHADQLEEVIKQRIKPPEVHIEGEFTISCYENDGVEVIKEAFKPVEKSNVHSTYKGAGKYYVSFKAPSYKEAESVFEPLIKEVTDKLEKHHATVSYKRLNKKK